MESENPASLPMSLSACPMRPAPTMVHAQSLLTAAILRPCPAETAPPPRSWYAARDTLAGAGTISLRMRIRPRACECTCVKTHSLLGSQHRLIEQGSSLREPFDVRYTCTQAQVSADSRSYSACSEIPCRRHYKAARKLRSTFASAGTSTRKPTCEARCRRYTLCTTERVVTWSWPRATTSMKTLSIVRVSSSSASS